MSMRTSERVTLAVAVALLAGCSRGSEPSDDRALAEAEARQRAAADDDGMVLCAQGAGSLTRTCSVEQASTSRGLMLTLRHPDGSFHRLLATRDGRGLVAADGATPARIAVVGPDLIEVALDGDRYRLPATVRKPR